MNVIRNASLRTYNTFGVESVARRLVVIETADDLLALVTSGEIEGKRCVIIGGGSNVVLAESIDATVLLNRTHGIEIVSDTDVECVVRFSSGETWHSAVAWSVDRDLGGMENLALIPGTVGAAPIQNIGAYGTEAESVIVAVHAIDLRSGEHLVLSREECAFGYRDSVFKHELKDKVFITAVDMRLHKHPTVNTAYADVQRELTSRGIVAPTVRDVFDAVVSIRRRKLPDVSVLGNAGSFFKNPTVSSDRFNALRIDNPTMPGFDAGDHKKIPAAWLIEQCGCKGMRHGDAGVYEHHALVLVNHGAATASDILHLADEIRRRVHERFSIMLDIEVGIVGPASSIRNQS